MKSIKLMVFIMLAGIACITSCSEVDHSESVKKENNSTAKLKEGVFEITVLNDSTVDFNEDEANRILIAVDSNSSTYADIMDIINGNCESCKKNCKAYKKISTGNFLVTCDDGYDYYASIDSNGVWHLATGYWVDACGGHCSTYVLLSSASPQNLYAD